ncbi:MAG: hypothetical protein ACSHWU_03835 [Marinicella sp.]
MKLQHLKTTLIMGFSLIVSMPSVAGFDITRMTTVVDDLSGSYTVTKNGRLDDLLFTGTSITEFNQFHPGQGEHEATISGVILKQTSRGDGQLSTLADGAFMLESLEGLWDVSFTDLSVQASDAGVELSGSVMVNEDSYDAAELPEGVARLLRKVFWLTRR